eukprot:COSAG01_NODE_3533_length_5962_cov_41.705611_7_plen_94_part_00
MVHGAFHWESGVLYSCRLSFPNIFWRVSIALVMTCAMALAQRQGEQAMTFPTFWLHAYEWSMTFACIRDHLQHCAWVARKSHYPRWIAPTARR